MDSLAEVRVKALKAAAILGAERLFGVLPQTVASGQRIYCANHTSHLDALLVLAALPPALRERARPVAAAGYWTSTWLRRHLSTRVFGTVLIERDRWRLNPLEGAFDALRRGDSLIFFPEGTRGPGGGWLQPLKPGVYYLARRFRNVEVMPVWIEGAHLILPKHALLPSPAKCEVRFGEPLRWDGKEDAASFLARLREAMRQR